MRFPILLAACVVFTGASLSGAGEPDATRFLIPAAPAASAGQPAPIALVVGWIAENAPECPPSTAPEVAAGFLEQLNRSRPGEADRLGSEELPLKRVESQLWQALAVRLAGPAYEAQREAFAIRRAQGILAAQGGEAGEKTVEAAVKKLKNESAASYRRLTEGRMEDEDVLRLPGLNSAREAQRKSAALAPAQPRTLTAQEIAGEYARRNQTGAAAANLRAYRLTARVIPAGGVEQELQLFRLRPGYFRLHVRVAGKESQVLAYDGTRYWRQAGAKIEQVNPEALGALRYLGEFVDPLFEADGRRFERLEDTVLDGRKCYRLRFQRADGSGYVAVLDQENFHQVARENPDGTRARYGDFRDFAGLTLAYREELVLPDGQVTRLEIRRLASNPGLIAAFFAAPVADQLDLGPLEQVLAKTSTP